MILLVFGDTSSAHDCSSLGHLPLRLDTTLSAALTYSFTETLSTPGYYCLGVAEGPSGGQILYGFSDIEPFMVGTVVVVHWSICVIQLGVQQPNETVSWLPGYGYPDSPISQCQNMTEVLGQDVLDRMIVLHQFIINGTYVEIVV
jgi:hypothetical protein